MDRMLKRIRRAKNRKVALVTDLEQASDEKKRLDLRVKALREEVMALFEAGERIGRVQKTEVRYKVVTPRLRKKLEEKGLWEEVTVEKVDMRKLDSVLKSNPQLERLLEFDVTDQVRVHPKKG